MPDKLRHGGDIDAAEDAFGTPEAGWLDLSTGINPTPYPVGELDPAIWQRLPTKSDEQALLDAARDCYGVPAGAGIVAAPGTQAIIQWLPVAAQDCRIQILGPTYEEHAKTWHARGHTIEMIENIEDADADVVIAVNPNNPNGRIVEPGLLMDAAARLSGRGVLIVDEAFADVSPDISVTPQAGQPGLLVLRSFGKFYGLAGLRLGFAIGAVFDTDMIRDALGPWAVAGPALIIGARALADTAWQERTQARLVADAARLDGILETAGMEIVGGTPLYRLTRSSDAALIYETLGRAGIMVRKFDYDPAWLRFGLPGNENDWARLEQALR